MIMVVFANKAKANHALHGKDVICATLAYNAGYEEQGDLYSAKVEPFWDDQQVFITALSQATVDYAFKRVDEGDGTLASITRLLFIKKCDKL